MRSVLDFDSLGFSAISLDDVIFRLVFTLSVARIFLSTFYSIFLISSTGGATLFSSFKGFADYPFLATSLVSTGAKESTFSIVISLAIMKFIFSASFIILSFFVNVLWGLPPKSIWLPAVESALSFN